MDYPGSYAFNSNITIHYTITVPDNPYVKDKKQRVMFADDSISISGYVENTSTKNLSGIEINLLVYYTNSSNSERSISRQLVNITLPKKQVLSRINFSNTIDKMSESDKNTLYSDYNDNLIFNTKLTFKVGRNHDADSGNLYRCYDPQIKFVLDHVPLATYETATLDNEGSTYSVSFHNMFFSKLLTSSYFKDSMVLYCKVSRSDGRDSATIPYEATGSSDITKEWNVNTSISTNYSVNIAIIIRSFLNKNNKADSNILEERSFSVILTTEYRFFDFNANGNIGVGCQANTGGKESGNNFFTIGENMITEIQGPLRLSEPLDVYSLRSSTDTGKVWIDSNSISHRIYRQCWSGKKEIGDKKLVTGISASSITLLNTYGSAQKAGTGSNAAVYSIPFTNPDNPTNGIAVRMDQTDDSGGKLVIIFGEGFEDNTFYITLVAEYISNLPQSMLPNDLQEITPVPETQKNSPPS